ncbi:MAG TPA: hypothetical protein VFV83_07945 [Chthoniobacteraceae bacterium]|nr:hypothetical protein [Chthoniobacteraceae bacterium]
MLLCTPGLGRALEPADGDVDVRVPLSEAVAAFNRAAAGDPIGKEQLPLTEASVVAAIRWATLDRQKLEVSDATFAALEEITKTLALPKRFELEKQRGYEPNDRVTFDVWSVRLRIPGGPFPGGSTCITIEERMLSSRLIGEEERKVIHKFKAEEREGIGSFQRVEWMRRYREERARAAVRDAEKARR